MMEISEEAIATLLETLAEMREVNRDLIHLNEMAEEKALKLEEENRELYEGNHKLVVENARLREKLEGEGEDE